MAFTLSALDYTLGSPTYTAQQDRLLIAGLTGTEGVRNAPTATTGDLAVTTTGAANSSVNVAAGHLFFAGASGQGTYYAYNDAAATVGPLAANASGNPRIDVIVARVTDSATPSVVFAVLQGTPAASPTAPTVTKTSTTIEITLAQIAVPNGFTATTTILAGNITDVRPRSFITANAVPATTNAGIASYIPAASAVVGQTVRDGNGLLRVYDGTNWPVLYANNAVYAYSPTMAGTTGPTSFTNNQSDWSYWYTGNGAGVLHVRWQITLNATTWGATAATYWNLPLWNATTAFAPTGFANTGTFHVGTGIYSNSLSIYQLTCAPQAAAAGATPAQVMIYVNSSATAANLSNLSSTVPIAATVGTKISVDCIMQVSAVY